MGYESMYFLNISKDRKWIRVCEKLSQPSKGNLTWVPTGKSTYGYDEKWSRGAWKVLPTQTDRMKEYTFYCDAFLNYKNGHFIRMGFPTSTREERESKLFFEREDNDNSDVIDGLTRLALHI